MEYYKFRAKDKTGQIVSGTMAAVDEQELHSKLKQEDKLLISAKVEKNKTVTKKLKLDRVSDFSRNVGKLIGAGVSLVRALKIISEDESIKPKEREIYVNILKLVRSGMTLSDALAEQGDAFPTLFINMYKSAESSGNLDQVANRMADYYSKEYRLNQKVKSSMTYPKILATLIVIVVAIIMGFVLPQFSDLFAKMDTLPASTRMLLGLSDLVVHKWYAIIFVVAVLVMVFKIVFSIPSVRYHKDKLEIHFPVMGKLKKIIYTARFARTLSSLYSSGIPIVTSLQIAKTTVGNLYIESQFDQVIAAVRAGGNLSEALDKVDGFTKKLTSAVMVGEETGALDTMLVSIADQMEYDSELAINKLVSMIEPIMIVLMAVIVGFIIIAIIQPIYGSYQAIANSY